MQDIEYKIKDAREIGLNQKVRLTGVIVAIAGDTKSKDIIVTIQVDEFEKFYNK